MSLAVAGVPLVDEPASAGTDSLVVSGAGAGGEALVGLLELMVVEASLDQSVGR